jgi:phage terminase large subunit-like protein
MNSYIEDVISGKKLVPDLVKSAIQRHINDLERDDIYFDREAADHAIDFFGYLKHSKGKFAGQTFVLSDWQRFIVGSLFGWKNTIDDLRRFRSAYIEVPRKNGKTTLLSGIALYMQVADNEPGAEVYAVATKKDQAKILFNESKRMVESSPVLRRRYTSHRNMLFLRKDEGSTLQPLSSDANNLDGLNVHCGILDELHAHPNSSLWDILENGTGARRQPLIIAITTAGTNVQSYCYELRSYCIKVIQGLLENDTMFSIIYSAEEFTKNDTDAWKNASTWQASNPNYGISNDESYFQTQIQKASSITSSKVSFTTKNLNIWHNGGSDSAIPHENWILNTGTFSSALEGRRCWVGLDLSSTTDLTSVAYIFEPVDDDEIVDIKWNYWLPKENLVKASDRDKVDYAAWESQGWLNTTSGNMIDYAFILDSIGKSKSIYNIVDLGFDRWGAAQVSNQISDIGIEVIPIGQGFASMSSPSKEFERLIFSGKIRSNGDPVIAWMVSNLSWKYDPAGNIKPDKSANNKKIDGVVAAIMGIDRFTRSKNVKPSIYNSRGIRTLG